MNILFIANGIPTPQYPLMGIFELDQAKALAQEGHNVILFGIDLRSIRRKRPLGLYLIEKAGVKQYIFSLPVGAVPTGILCFIGRWALRYLYNKVFRSNHKPDIIHAHFTEIGYIASKLAQEERIPLVITEHSSKINQKDIPYPLKKYADYAYRHANVIISVSNALKKNIFYNFGIQSQVIPNIISLENFSYCPKEHIGFGYISTANLVEIKCPELLIYAFAEIHNIYPSTFLGLVGNGPLKTKLEHLVKKLSLEDSVFFYGQLSRKQIAKLYSNYDCFVLASSSETFGVAYIEAMACGLPIIATKCGGPEDFVNENNGLLVATNSLKELVSGMITMHDNYFKYDRASINRYAIDNFSPNKIAEKLLKLYWSVYEE